MPALVNTIGFRPVSYTHLDVYKRQESGWIIYRIKPDWRNGNLFVENHLGRYLEEVTKPPAEQGSPEHCGQTTVEKHLNHSVSHAFQCKFSQYDKTCCGNDNPIDVYKRQDRYWSDLQQ